MIFLTPGVQYFAVATAYNNASISSSYLGTYLLVFNPEVTLNLAPAPVAAAMNEPIRTILVVDAGALLSVLISAIPTALAQRELGLSASHTALRDFGGRLFRARAKVQQGLGDATSASVLEEETVVMGEGDGEEAGESGQGPKKVVIQRTIPKEDRWEVFSSFDYGRLDMDAVGELRGLRHDVYSGNAGAEHVLGDRLVVGLGVAGLESDGEVAGGAADTDVQGITMAGYLTGMWGESYVDLLYGANLLEHSISRRTGTGIATAEPDSVVHEVQLNLGHDWEFGNVVTGPMIGADYSHIDIDGYTERGGGDRAVRVGGQTRW